MADVPGMYFDYEKLDQLAEQYHDAYQQNQPFQHIVLDDFIPLEKVRELVQAFPPPTKEWQTRDNTAYANKKPVQINKIGIRTDLLMHPAMRQFLWELQSQSFIRFLEKLTGIPNLLADPSMRGGGTHQTLPGGMLQIHADFNVHPDYRLDRRLNLLLYLNEDWQDDWGGELELWLPDMSACAKKLLPIAGRLVVFSTGSDTWHGHPKPVACPEGNARKSIALYYYTNGRPDKGPEHKTVWQEPPEE